MNLMESEYCVATFELTMWLVPRYNLNYSQQINKILVM